ncbi:flagellar basal body P-ring formation protein FlgA [Photobacterium sp. BZF1]|uniref:flagellar basal body P-ring formation chaperone FlgA n=1 Tax=Photobacterium sp. BZF1 TaxID=1904457 RepID=UPI001653E03C|nr:flagellar basal body P-ring formation chaperone FlgA [Photobacterium sp. BZF1]MBC7001614.1 flagellar basal body P-ring formation protein FlgA [Photobacterium sp. BZF1]
MCRAIALRVFFVTLGYTLCSTPVHANEQGQQQLFAQLIRTRIETSLQYHYPTSAILDIKLRISRAVSNLPSCTDELLLSSNSAVKLGNQKWKITCGSAGWVISATSTTLVTVTAITAAKSMKKGHRLTLADIELKPTTLYKAQPLFFSYEAVLGSKLKRRVNKGDVLTSARLYINYAVEKGHPVKVLYQSKTFQLETKGLALENGVVGDTIAIENLQSGKRLQGVVMGKGSVKVL